MPDESCRICGGNLISRSLCSECKKVIQRVCRTCGMKTEEQFHYECLPLDSRIARNETKTDYIMLPNPSLKLKKSNSLPNSLMIVGLIGLVALGFAVTDIGNFIEITDITDNQPEIKTVDYVIQNPSQVKIDYQNCLGYANGLNITLRCPTETGKVYEAILLTPPDLIEKFSSDAFNIRGVSLVENHDGSVIIGYQDGLYRTNFSGCSLIPSGCK